MAQSLECPVCGKALPMGAEACPWHGTLAAPKAPGAAVLTRLPVIAPGFESPFSGVLATTDPSTARGTAETYVREPLSSERSGPVGQEPTTPVGAPLSVADTGLTVQVDLEARLSRSESTNIQDPLLGRSLGSFRIDRLVGAGGMARVYRGTHVPSDRVVAIKVLRGELVSDPLQVGRIEAEARALAKVRHPHVVEVIDHGTVSSGRPYLVMEFLEGRTLHQVVRAKGPLEVSEFIAIMTQVLDGLQAAHEAGITHRDLTASNIFLLKGSSPPHAKLVDFGFAKAGVPGAATAQTAVHYTVGTVHFIPPEQARGEAVSAQSDLYSLGVVMFLALTGTLPFDAPSDRELLKMHHEAKPPRLRELRADIPPPLEQLVLRMLSKKPAQRPASAERVKRELSAIARLEGMAAPPTDPLRTLSNPRVETPINTTVFQTRAQRLLLPAVVVMSLAALGVLLAMLTAT